MHNLQPATKYNELCEALQEARGYRYASKDTLAWRRIVAEAKNLCNVKPSEGWTILTLAYSQTGDVEATRGALSNAMKFQPDQSDQRNMYHALTNLGLFSEAQKMYQELAMPERGGFTRMAPSAGEIGAYRTLKAYAERARAMNIELDDTIKSLMETAAPMLERVGLTDEDIAHHLDAAGAVMRAHGLLPIGELVITADNGDFAGVTNVFNVDVTPEEAFNLNIELAQEEERIGVKKTGVFEVVFSPMPS